MVSVVHLFVTREAPLGVCGRQKKLEEVQPFFFAVSSDCYMHGAWYKELELAITKEIKFSDSSYSKYVNNTLIPQSQVTHTKRFVPIEYNHSFFYWNMVFETFVFSVLSQYNFVHVSISLNAQCLSTTCSSVRKLVFVEVLF